MKYFSAKELECHCDRCKDKGTYKYVSPILKERLDKLRGLYGKPIYVSCAYRCPEHNKEVGGVDNSTHVNGTAADIYVDGDYEEFFNLVKKSKLFDGVGKYSKSEFVHVDVRENGKLANTYQWIGD